MECWDGVSAAQIEGKPKLEFGLPWQLVVHPLELIDIITVPRPCPVCMVSGATGADRVLTRVVSESSIRETFTQPQSTSAVAAASLALEKVTSDGWVGQDQSGAAVLRRGTEHTLGSVLEDTEASESPRAKIVKFRSGRSNGGDPVIEPLALDGVGTVKPTLGALTGSKKGGRRYSMDDYGVSIAHRAELQTSQVVFPTFTLGIAQTCLICCALNRIIRVCLEIVPIIFQDDQSQELCATECV